MTFIGLSDEQKRDLDKRVMRGVRLLDKKRPTWPKRVKLGELDLNSCNACVLGQAFAADARRLHDDWTSGFGVGLEKLGIQECEEAGRHGFDKPSSGSSFYSIPVFPGEANAAMSYLQEKWTRIIARRQKAAKRA